MHRQQGRQSKLTMRLADVPAGTYHLLIQTTDAQGNQSLTASSTSMRVDAPTTDLSGRFVHVPSTAKAGRKTGVSVAITNSGNVAVSTNLQIGLYATTSGVVDSTAIAIAVKPHRIHIQPGKSQTIALTGLTLASPAGSYFLVATLDPNGLLTDSDLTNNTFRSGSTVTVTPSSR